MGGNLTTIIILYIGLEKKRLRGFGWRPDQASTRMLYSEVQTSDSLYTDFFKFVQFGLDSYFLRTVNFYLFCCCWSLLADHSPACFACHWLLSMIHICDTLYLNNTALCIGYISYLSFLWYIYTWPVLLDLIIILKLSILWICLFSYWRQGSRKLVFNLPHWIEMSSYKALI